MAPVIRRIYDQMLEPKWVIAMGACASSAGVFNNYALVQGADKFLPVDVHVPGCPPRPEALIHGIIKLQHKIQGHPDLGWRTRYEAEGTEEQPHPNVTEGAANQQMPDATGLELIAHELRDRFPGSVADTDHHRGVATLVVEPESVIEVLRWLRDEPDPELPLPRPACMRATTCRASRASGSTTSS